MEHLIRTGFGIKERPAVASTQDEETHKMQNSRVDGKTWTLVQKGMVSVLVFGAELTLRMCFLLLTVLCLIYALLGIVLGINNEATTCLQELQRNAHYFIKPNVNVSS